MIRHDDSPLHTWRCARTWNGNRRRLEQNRMEKKARGDVDHFKGRGFRQGWWSHRRAKCGSFNPIPQRGVMGGFGLFVTTGWWRRRGGCMKIWVPQLWWCTAPPICEEKRLRGGKRMWEAPLADEEMMEAATGRMERKAGWGEMCLVTDAPRRTFNLHQEPNLDLLVFSIRLHKKSPPPHPRPLFFSFLSQRREHMKGWVVARWHRWRDMTPICA